MIDHIWDGKGERRGGYYREGQGGLVLLSYAFMCADEMPTQTRKSVQKTNGPQAPGSLLFFCFKERGQFCLYR